MSTSTPSRKRKNPSGVVNMSNIQGKLDPRATDALVAVKPHILDFQTTDFAVLEASLVRLNELLEQFTSARANKKRSTTAEPAADELDRE
ncbi:hypothetical protein FRC09_019753, partial [Ceratobasidium sp. 395]